MNFAVVSGVIGLGSRPRASSFSATSGFRSAAVAPSLTLRTTSAGRPAGPTSPNHASASTSARPAWAVVGTSGRVGQRSGAAIARMRILPALASPMPAIGESSSHWTSPLTRRVHQPGGAAVGDVRALAADLALDHLARDVRQGADAGRAVVHLAALGPHHLDEVGDRPRVALGGDHEHHRGHHHHGDRREIPGRIERQRRVERRVDRQRAGVGREQRVAVGRRLRDRLGRDVAAGARLALDDERLAERLGKLLGDEARRGVARPARREADQHAHRLRRPGLGRGRGGESDDASAGQQKRRTVIGGFLRQVVAGSAERFWTNLHDSCEPNT